MVAMPAVTPGLLDPSLMMELHTAEAQIGGLSLIDFVGRLTPNFVPPWHLWPIAQLFARAEYKPIRACVSVPPRHGKTELFLHAIPWWLSRHPEQTIGYASYSGNLAASKSKRAMDLAHLAQIFLRKDIQRADQWRTPSGGGVIASGIGGSMTGHGVNLLLIDDPTKNREEAESPTVRDNNYGWLTSTALTRIEPGGSAIVMHTRWHADDMIGRLSKEGWEVINLPAIGPCGPLWPGRWSKESLEAKRKEIGEYDWWSLYMGEPRPRGGKLFNEPVYYDKPDVLNARLLIACDPAATAKTHADYSAIVVAAVKPDAVTGRLRADILEAYRVQVEIPQLVQLLHRVQQKWSPTSGKTTGYIVRNPTPIIVESVGAFKAVPQMLRQIDRNIKIVEITPAQDKFTRSLPTAAAWNDGHIRLPSNGAAWVGPFVSEVTSFSGVGDKNDDQVDALSHLYGACSRAMAPNRPLRGGAAQWLPFG